MAAHELRDLGDAIARPARGADHDGDARAGGELDDGRARAGVGDVERDVGAEHLVETRPRVERRMQFEVVGLVDESKRQLPHLAGGPGHGDPFRHDFTLASGIRRPDVAERAPAPS